MFKYCYDTISSVLKKTKGATFNKLKILTSFIYAYILFHLVFAFLINVNRKSEAYL